MKTMTRLTGLLLLIASSVTMAQTKLKLEVYTSAATGFSVNSVLIHGENEAILVDPQHHQ